MDHYTARAFPYATLFRSHEAYLRLVDQTTPQQWDGRGRFFAAAAEAMRQKNAPARPIARSEENTSELQSRQELVCRLLLEKKKTILAGNAKKGDVLGTAR